MSSFRDRQRQEMPDTDLYTVIRFTRDEATGFFVGHYPSRAATAPCCRVEILQAPDESDTAALRRAYEAIEAQHAARLERSA